MSARPHALWAPDFVQQVLAMHDARVPQPGPGEDAVRPPTAEQRRAIVGALATLVLADTTAARGAP